MGESSARQTSLEADLCLASDPIPGKPGHFRPCGREAYDLVDGWPLADGGFDVSFLVCKEHWDRLPVTGPQADQEDVETQPGQLPESALHGNKEVKD